MVKCAINLCRNDSRTRTKLSYRITYHRFPNDPDTKNKWIEATGRSKKWFPTKYSRMCSVHFHEDLFIITTKSRRLISTAYPTYQIKGKPSSEKESINNMPIKIKLENNISEPSSSDEIPIHTMQIEEMMCRLNKANQMIIEKDKQIKCLTEQSRRRANKIHTLVELLRTIKNKILISNK